jgi:hypothetical protein
VLRQVLGLRVVRGRAEDLLFFGTRWLAGVRHNTTPQLLS